MIGQGRTSPTPSWGHYWGRPISSLSLWGVGMGVIFSKPLLTAPGAAGVAWPGVLPGAWPGVLPGAWPRFCPIRRE
jgi:hypothetical protein